MTTPIEQYNGIYVKRDDLCFDPPAPPFSKCRGLLLHLKALKKKGVTTVGYTETSISMAGWGVAWACDLLDMKAVIFNPVYNDPCDVLIYHRQKWATFPSTEVIDIDAGMAKVNWYICKAMLKQAYPNSVLLPLGLPFPETVEATMKETEETFTQLGKNFQSIVCCVGSGTIIAGIWKGLNTIRMNTTLYGVMTRTGSIPDKMKRIEHKSGQFDAGFFVGCTNLQLIDPGWEYTAKSGSNCPFPCHPYYDLKAWEWLMTHQHKLPKPILFWNIGH